MTVTDKYRRASVVADSSGSESNRDEPPRVIRPARDRRCTRRWSTAVPPTSNAYSSLGDGDDDDDDDSSGGRQDLPPSDINQQSTRRVGPSSGRSPFDPFPSPPRRTINSGERYSRSNDGNQSLSSSSSSSRLSDEIRRHPQPHRPPRPPTLWDSSSTMLSSAVTTQHGQLHNSHTQNSQTRKEDEEGDSNHLTSNGIVDLGSDGDHRPTVKMKLPRDSDIHGVSYTYASRPTHYREDSETNLSSGHTSPNFTDYEASSDEYDWSGEEDLAEEAGKYVEKFGKKPKRTGWGPKRLFSLAFSSLIGSTLTASLIALPAILVHFLWYKPNPSEHRKYIDQNVQAWLFWVAANIVISWHLAMIIDVVPIVFQYSLFAVWGHVSEAIKTKMEMYDAVKNTAKPAFYGAGWLASYVIIFKHIYGLYDPEEGVDSRAPYTERLFQVVLFGFFFILVVCVQKMLTHYVAFNFHTVAYKERIEVVEKRLSVFEKLQSYKPKRQHQKNPSSGSGMRTPFGNNRMSGSHMAYDVNLLTARLHALAPQRPPLSRLASNVTVPQANSSGNVSDGYAEDNERTLVESKDKAKKSRKTTTWFRRSKKPAVEDPISLQDLALGDRGNDIKGVPPAYLRGGNSPDVSRPVSPTNHRRMKSAASESRPALVSVGKALKNAVLHDARNISGKEQDLSSLAWNVTSTGEAKRLARTLFNRLRDRRRKYLIESDFYPAFSTKEEAEEAFRVIDEDGNGDLSRPEIKRVLVRTYRERRFLSRSLRDAGQALKTLDWILFFFAMIILFLISLSVFGVDVGDSLTSVYSIIIAASFIFKNSASRAFDAIMFLFVTHPFDTGDRVFVMEENLIVKKMGLFATTFTRADGTETYYFNSMLFKQFITNARRSGKTTEQMAMQVAWKTPLAKLDALEKYLNEWIETEENRWFNPTGITLQHIVYQKYLTMTVGIAHNGNWQDWGLRLARRTTFHAAVQSYCRELGITGYEAPLPVTYSEPNPNSVDDSVTGIMDDDAASIAASVDEQRVEEEIEEAAKNVKPSLGFLPPLPERSNRLRARKSRRSKKNRLQAMNAEC